MALAVLAVVASAVVAVRRPWAIAVLIEGFPGHTWPASGDAVEIGDADESPPIPTDRLRAGADFLIDFESSDGSAIAVARGGEIEFTHFAAGYGPDTAFNSYSMVKSLVGLLTVKAVSDGRIPDLDATVGELWDDAADSPVAGVTIRRLLDMRSQIVFEHEAGDVGGAGTSKEQAITYSPFSDFSRLHIEGPDAVIDHVEVVASEGDRFVYQNLNTAILGRVIEEVGGRPLEVLLDEEIATPAGAGGFRWRRHDDGRVSAYCCLYATVAWWIAVGDHILDNGGDQPLLSDDWHAYFLGLDLGEDVRGDGEYRSQTRYDVFDRDGEDLDGPFLYFSGRGGQVLYLVPDEDLVVVRFGQLNQRLHTTMYQVAGFEPR